MRITNINPETHPTEAYRDEELTDGERVEFNDDWRARTKKHIGEALCDEYDHIVPVDNGDETDADSASDEE